MNDQLSLAVLVSVAVCAGALMARYFFSKKMTGKDTAIRDLTDRLGRLTQESTDDQVELNAILSSMVEGVMVIGADDRILYVSPNLSAMFQMRTPDVASKRYWEVIPHQQIIASVKEALQSKGAVNKEINLITPADIFFSMQVSPVIQGGVLKSVVAVFHDITELKRLLKMRSEFVANVSHELKTPLTSIKGFVETLQDEGNCDQETQKRFLDIIHKQTQRLEMLVDDLLTLSAIESKEGKMDFSPQDLGSIVQSVVHMHKPALDASGHQLRMELPLGLPKILADRHRIEQVVLNLLDNAMKFTSKGGQILIKASVQRPFIRLDVQDTGVGIGPEHLTRIFERFYRVDKARSIQKGGTGLGLSIVKHIVQSHQGKIEVQSRLGQGSTFSIFLPAVNQSLS